MFSTSRKSQGPLSDNWGTVQVIIVNWHKEMNLCFKVIIPPKNEHCVILSPFAFLGNL